MDLQTGLSSCQLGSSKAGKERNWLFLLHVGLQFFTSKNANTEESVTPSLLGRTPNGGTLPWDSSGGEHRAAERFGGGEKLK